MDEPSTSKTQKIILSSQYVDEIDENIAKLGLHDDSSEPLTQDLPSPLPLTQEYSRKRKYSFTNDDNAKVMRMNSVDDDTQNTLSSMYSQENTYNKGGLVHSLHGVVYQLKLNMLFLKRALENGYEFQLGTDVEDADKFDDVVFKYKRKDEKGTDEIRFVQVKHKQDETKKITANDLLKSENSSSNEFSLQKYFVSFCKIKRNPKFSNFKLKDVIIYTNIEFGDLEKASIGINHVVEDDDILEVTDSGKSTERCQLIIPKEHQLYEKLRETSDLHVLTKVLKQHILENRSLQLTVAIFKVYHIALCEYIFDIVERRERNKQGRETKKSVAKFRDDFINGTFLSKTVENFRNAFEAAFKSNDKVKFWREMSQKELKISAGFGEQSSDQSLSQQSQSSQTHTNTALPIDRIEDSEIEEFFSKLTFAVNQPNEEELGRIICHELGNSSFNLLSAELVIDSFQSKMIDWFKEKRPIKGEEGVWLNAESGKSFINSIEQKTSSLISVGISVAYPEKLATKYGIATKINNVYYKLKDFLFDSSNGSYKIFQLVTSKKSLLSAISVFNSLEYLKQIPEFRLFNKYDSHIFTSLSVLFQMKTQRFMMKAFESEDNNHLLIINCNTTSFTNSESLKLQKKLAGALAKPKKQLVLISSKQNLFGEGFKDVSKSTFEDDTNFDDLTDVSKERLLLKEVNFQGRYVGLNKLVDKLDEQVKCIVDIDVINTLLKGDEICISKSPQSLDEVIDYYIHRRFRQVIISKEKIKIYIEQSQQTDIFVISGVDSGLHNSNAFEFDNDSSAEEKFNELSVQNKQFNIHLLRQNASDVIWYKSCGSISNLLNFRIKEQLSSDSNHLNCIDEADFFRCKNLHDIVIIANTAGMGKSTVLTHLSMELKKSFNSLWIVRVNLNDHTAVLYKILNTKFNITGLSKNELADFLFHDLSFSREQSDLEKNLFFNNFNKKGKFVFLFDGFDEICPLYKDIVIDILQLLKKYEVGRIFVTTRPNLRQELEQALHTFSHVLKPLSKYEQIQFLIKFWVKKLSIKNNCEIYSERLQIYAKSVVEYISNSIKDKKQEFICIPLQTMMLAEVFQTSVVGISASTMPEWQGCKEFLESDVKVPSLPNTQSLLDLYENFVRKKFYEFHLTNKKKRVLTIVGETKTADRDFKIFKDDHSVLALKTFLNEKELNELLSAEQITQLEALCNDFQSNDLNEGIIDQFIENKPHFIHRTFAEYFASFIIAEKLLTNPVTTLNYLENIIMNTSSIFIDNIIKQLEGKHGKITYILKIPLLHHVITKPYSNFIASLAMSNIDDWPKKLDNLGKTPLHYAVEHKKADIAQTILDNISQKDISRDSNLLSNFINIQDNAKKTALHYVVNQSVFFSFHLISQGANVELLSDEDIGNVMCLLNKEYICVKKNILTDNYGPILKRLLLQAPATFTKITERHQFSILSYFGNGDFETYSKLSDVINNKERKSDLLSSNISGSLVTVLNLNMLDDEGRLGYLKHLLNCGAAIPQSKKMISEILNVFYERKHVKTFVFFLDQVNYLDHLEFLYKECKDNRYQLDILQYYFQKGIDCNISMNALQIAYQNRSIKIILYILNMIGFNATNDNNDTPLTILMKSCNMSILKITKYLIDKGSDVNHQNLSGNTPLVYALENNKKDVIRCLLKYGARIPENAPPLVGDMMRFYTDPHQFNIDLVDENGLSRLHLALMASEYRWAKFLITHGADVNIEDRNGKTPLHLASIIKHDELGELLLEYGAMFDTGKFDHDPLDFVSPSDGVFSWLLQKLTTIFYSSDSWKNIKKKSILHLLTGPIGSDYNRIRYIKDTSASILLFFSAKNYQAKTFLHILAASDDIESHDMNEILNFLDEFLTQNVLLIQSAQNVHNILRIFNERDMEGNTPLHIACKKGRYQIVSFLLGKSVIIDSKNLQTEIPEELALKNNHLYIAKLLKSIRNLFVVLWRYPVDITEVYHCIEENVIYLNVRNESGQSPLHLASCLDDQLVVQLLLNSGADMEAIDLNKNRPLHVAAQNDKIEIVKLLLKHGAVYNAQNAKHQTPFDLQYGPCFHLLNQIEKLFMDVASCEFERVIHNFESNLKIFGVDVSAVINTRDVHGNTLLHIAAEACEKNIVEYLLANGAMFDVKNYLFETPLSLTKDPDIMTLLSAINDMFEYIDAIFWSKHHNIKMEIILNVRNSKDEGILHQAILSRSLQIVKFLVENGIVIDLTNINYNLFQSKSHMETIKYLIDNGNITSTDSIGNTGLVQAIIGCSNVEIIEHFVTKGSDINKENKLGLTPLVYAIATDKDDVIKYLLKHGAHCSEKTSQLIKDKVAFYKNPAGFDLNFVDQSGCSRLHEAIKSHNLEWVKFLVHHKVDVNMQDRQGNTPLHLAVLNTQTDIAELLIRNNAIFDKKNFNNHTPRDMSSFSDNIVFSSLDILHELFESNDVSSDMNKLLKSKQLKKRRDYLWNIFTVSLLVHARNSQGQTLLHRAASKLNSKEALQKLLQLECYYLEKNANTKHPEVIYKADNEKNTALHIAAMNGNDENVCFLLENGATFNNKNLLGQTPEDIAKMNNTGIIVSSLGLIKKVFEDLEQNKVNLLDIEKVMRIRGYMATRNESGESLLHVAASCGQHTIAQLLLEDGAYSNAVDFNWNTPLHNAARHNHTSLVKLLLKYGAMCNVNNKIYQTPLELSRELGNNNQSCQFLEQIDIIFRNMKFGSVEALINDIKTVSEIFEIDISDVINMRDYKLNTLLHYSVKFGKFDNVKYLLESGAIYNPRNKLNETPSQLTNDKAITKLLKLINSQFRNLYDFENKYGHSFEIVTNVRDKAGKQILQYAIEASSFVIVRGLIKLGAKVNLTHVDYNLTNKIAILCVPCLFYLIDNGDINITNSKGETALFKAIIDRSILEIIQYLIAKGSDINKKDLFGNTPLSCALETEQEDIILYLIENGANISEEASQLTKDKLSFFQDSCHFDLVNDNNDTFRLHKAIKDGDYNWAEFLVRRGADVNKLDRDGNSPLHISCTDENIVRVLLQHGAVFDLKNNSNHTPNDQLGQCDRKHISCLEILHNLFYGFNLMESLKKFILPFTDFSSKTLVSEYFKIKLGCRDSDVVYILNAQNCKGQNILHIAAAFSNDVEAIEILLNIFIYYRLSKQDRTAIDAVDLEENTPLHIAAEKGHDKIVSFLLEHGAIFNKNNKCGESPEYLGVVNNRDKVVSLLKAAKQLFIDIEENNESIRNEDESIDERTLAINARNEDGKSPLHLAAALGHLNMVQWLIDNDADVAAVDNNKNTPLHDAALNDRIDIVKILLAEQAMFDAKNRQDERPFDVARGQSLELLERVRKIFEDVHNTYSRLFIQDLESIPKNSDLNIGIIVKICDYQLNTLLHYAAILCKYDLVKYLVSNGAFVDAQNIFLKTPVDITNDRNVRMAVNKVIKEQNIKHVEDVIDDDMDCNGTPESQSESGSETGSDTESEIDSELNFESDSELDTRTRFSLAHLDT